MSSLTSELCLFPAPGGAIVLSLSKSVKLVMFFNINNDFCRPFPYISMNCLNKFLDFTCKNASWRSLSIILGKLKFLVLSVLHRHSSDGSNYIVNVTAQKMKFSITDFFSKCDQIRSFLKKSVMENFIFLCSVSSSILALLILPFVVIRQL